MVAPAIPIIIGAGAWAYRLYRGYRAVRAVQTAATAARTVAAADKARKAAQLAKAAEQAAALSQAKARAKPCDNCEPPPNSKCAQLYAKIAELTRELAKRRADMLADRPGSEGGLGMYDLFLKDPKAVVPDPQGIRPNLGNWLGHSTQITQKQVQLKNLIEEYRKEGCSPLPPGAETQANLPPPTKPFSR